MKEEIGKRIKEIREEMHMTKEQFAKKLGLSGQHLGLIERGKNHISIEKLKILCDLSGLSADYILFGKDKNILNDTKNILSEFTYSQIVNGCDTLKKLALFIKD